MLLPHNSETASMAHHVCVHRTAHILHSSPLHIGEAFLFINFFHRHSYCHIHTYMETSTHLWSMAAVFNYSSVSLWSFGYGWAAYLLIPLEVAGTVSEAPIPWLHFTRALWRESGIRWGVPNWFTCYPRMTLLVYKSHYLSLKFPSSIMLFWQTYSLCICKETTHEIYKCIVDLTSYALNFFHD